MMSKEKRRVPKLRFPGFTEDWEQRKLSEVTTCFDNLRVPVTASDRVPGKIPYYGANGIQDYVSGYTHSGEFVLIAEDGANDLNDYPIQYVNGAIWVNNHAHVIAGYKEKLENKFLSYSLKTVKMSTFIVGGGRSKLNLKALLEISISMPNYDEQCCIGKFIETIDKTITLHQRKLDNLKLKKKALLQKLFPKNGERYPELRFPGFTDAWEQRKADYIFKSVTDKGYPELPVLSASQELGMVYRDQNGIDIQHDKKNETSYKRVLPGQFVIHLRSFQGGFAYSEIEGITSPAYTVMSFKNSSEQYGLFWKHVFKSETFIKRLETITYGIRDGRSISFSDFKSLLLQYPSFSEQKLIGDSIAVIERGITLHQRKLDHLQLQKKALLQQMFV